MLVVAAEIIEDQGVRANGHVLECTLDPVVWNDVVDFASGESMTQNTIIYSTLIECHLHANVELLMILVDAPMHTRICVMVEVAKLFEHVEIGSPKASTVTHSVTAIATVPGPVGNIMHDGLDGSRWDFCCPKDMAVKKKLWGYCYCVSRSSSQVCQGIWAGSVYSASHFESTSSLHSRVPSTGHTARSTGPERITMPGAWCSSPRN